MATEAHPPRDLLLVFERAEWGRVRRLRLSAHPDGPRLHLQHARVHKRAVPADPFFTRVESLVGARLVRLEQLGADRVVRLSFEAREGDAREGATRAAPSLVLELFGRRADLLLLEGEHLQAALVHADRGPWAPPPPAPGAPPAGPPLAEAFPPPESAPTHAAHLDAPLSWCVEAVLGRAVEERQRERDRKTLRTRLKRRLKRARALVRGLEERSVAAAGAQRVQQDGELLKAHLGQLPRGAEEVLVQDWFTEGAPERRIPLDPRKSPQANLERLFERYRKLARSGEAVERELGLAQERLGEVQALFDRCAHEDPIALEGEAQERGLLDAPQGAPKRRAKPAPRLPYKSFRTGDGSEVRVGRSARDNDELSFKHARGNDLWLHTADAPGSHVVLRLERGREPSQETLLDAAHLAAHFSPLSSEAKVDVHVARCKEVKKPRGAPPGLVTLAGGKTLALRIEADRLDRLLKRGSAR